MEYKKGIKTEKILYWRRRERYKTMKKIMHTKEKKGERGKEKRVFEEQRCIEGTQHAKRI